MRIAITGSTGFIGSHLAQRLATAGHELVLIARSERGKETIAAAQTKFVASDLSNAEVLVEAFAGCDAVAHCAGINREIGEQTYLRVHVEATKNVVAAAKQAGVRKVALMSFLRARPDCGSAYHESKWAAEEIVRNSGLDYTILKSGMVYGLGDHMLDHLSHALHTFPVFAMVGLKEKGIRPLAVEDLVKILDAALVKGRLKNQTVAVTGAEELYLSDAVQRVARVTGKKNAPRSRADLVSLHDGSLLGTDNEGSAGSASPSAYSRGGRGGAKPSLRFPPLRSDADAQVHR